MRKPTSNQYLRLKLANYGYKAAVGLIMATLIALPVKELVSLAQNTGPDTSSTSNPVSDSSLPTEDQLAQIQQAKNAQFLGQLNGEISKNQNNLANINQDISDHQNKVDQLQMKVDTLQSQLANLDNQIKNSEDIIKNVTGQIGQKNADIASLENDLELLNTEISFQKQNLADYLKTLYLEQNNVQNLDSDQISVLKLLLSGQQAGDVLNSLKYSDILQQTGQLMIKKLGDLTTEQKTKQVQLYLNRQSLLALNDQLVKEKNELEVRKKAKGALLNETKGQEKIYQDLLAASKAEQEQVSSDISTLKSNLNFISQRMSKLGKAFDPADYTQLLSTTTDQSIYQYLETVKGDNSLFQPRWPISPARGISAYFHDSAYAAVFGMQHNAIDIPTYQGTPIHAPAEGVVYKAKDNGMGYSYIILAHANGFMTVYGHVSEIDVKEGQLVREGDVIGLSGATPGTKGAGLYTTGPHLHFEIIKDGQYQDPLNFLNLAYLNLESLPEKYQAKALGDQQKVRRDSGKVPVKKVGPELTVEQMVELQGAAG